MASQDRRSRGSGRQHRPARSRGKEAPPRGSRRSRAWERDVSDGATDAPVSLYLRDHVLDQAWFSPSPEGMPNPYEPDSNVWHYQCEDIKIDSQQQGDADVAPFFQSDPEGSQPITHVLFDQLRDNSQNLAADTLALVHVQVHNRSFTPARNVRVWAIYCNAAAGMPALPDTFWHQFSRDGQITPNLPAHSRWKSIGQPTSVNEVSVTSPRVASWTWNVPALRRHDTGHYCMVVFVHGAAAPLDETSLDVDDLAYRNNQIGQKNLHLVSPPLPADSPSTGTAGGGAGERDSRREQTGVRRVPQSHRLPEAGHPDHRPHELASRDRGGIPTHEADDSPTAAAVTLRRSEHPTPRRQCARGAQARLVPRAARAAHPAARLLDREPRAEMLADPPAALPRGLRHRRSRLRARRLHGCFLSPSRGATGRARALRILCSSDLDQKRGETPSRQPISVRGAARGERPRRRRQHLRHPGSR